MSIQVRRPDGPNWGRFGTASKPGSPLPRAPISPQTGSPPYMLGSLGQRSVAVQAAPMPWTRFFFPEELGAESTGGLNPLFRHFDVHTVTDLSAEELALALDPPSWMPEAYQRLSFVQMRGIRDEKTVARDITQGGLKLMRQGGEEHLAQVNRFCRVVARFRPRTWSDTEPLINLLSGVVLYLLGQLSNAADVAALKLKAEYDLKFKSMQDAEASKYSRMLQKEQGFIRLDYEQRLQNVKVLQQHQGVSLALLDRETQSMVIRDISIDSNVHFFRRSASGIYTAAAVRNQDGSLGGMLCCDGPQPADAVEQGTDQQFAVQLAQAAATTLAALAQHKQEMLEAAALHMAEEESVSEGVILEELERHADLFGGRALLADASRELFTLKQVDIEKLTFLSDCSTSAWAIIRAAVTRKVSDKPLDLDSWSQLKQLLTLDFMSLVGKFNADGLGAGWPHIRQVLSDTLNMTEAEVVGQGPLVQALMKFLMGLKNVSAGLALEHMLQDRLSKANKAVERAFMDARADALAELKSYRVAPKYSFKVLKAVLFCLGQSINDADTWGQCRGLVNRSMIKKMLQLKPKTMPFAKIWEVRAVIKGLTEECVQNESMAALLLYKWLVVVLKVALTQPAKKYEEATDNA